MKYIFLFLLFPFTLGAQELPDTAAARKMRVKKVVVLIECDTLPTDTAAVWYFEKGKWVDVNRDPARKPERKPKNAIYDSKGQLIFEGTTPPDKKLYCTNDTLGATYAYDAQGRVIRVKTFSCEKGDKTWYYTYDSLGRPALRVNDPPLPIVLVTRQEFIYDSDGRLRTVAGWWAIHPWSAARDSTDNPSFRVEYSYDLAGLITAVVVDDPYYSFLGAPEWPGPDIAFPPPAVVYRYVYTYGD